MHIVNVGVTCPGCGVKFNSKQVPFVVDTGLRDSELRLRKSQGEAFSFEQLALCACPACGKADWASSFTVCEEKPHLQQQGSATYLQYKLAATQAEREGRDWFNIGLLYIWGAWLADDAQASSYAQELRKYSAEAFKKSLLDNSCPQDERVEIEYLIGEILRRAKEFEAAFKHFKEVIPGLGSQYAFMARKLMRLCESLNSEPIDFES